MVKMDDITFTHYIEFLLTKSCITKFIDFRFNSVSITGLRSALKRVAEIISKKHTSVYNMPTTDMIECVVNSSAGDVRSAVLNLHFACLKGN